MFGGDIEEASRIGAEQPFISGDCHEIRLNLLRVKIQCAAALGQVQYKRSPEFTAFFTDRLNVDQCAIGPANMCASDKSGIGPDLIEETLGQS